MVFAEGRVCAPLRQLSLDITDQKLGQPMQYFVLPHLSAALRLNLRATCTALRQLIDADSAYWAEAGCVHPALLTDPVGATQTFSVLGRQGHVMAHMRRGSPKARLVVPRGVRGHTLDGCWSQCTGNGSRFVTVSCRKHCIRVLDVITGELSIVQYPKSHSIPNSQWLDGNRLVASQHTGFCQVIAFSEYGCDQLWAHDAGMYNWRPASGSAATPAMLWTGGDPLELQLVSTTTFGIAGLPSPASSSFKQHLQDASWSPDTTHLALTFVQAHLSNDGQLDLDGHVVCIYRMQESASISHVVLQGFSKALWSPDSQILALFNNCEQSIMLWRARGQDGAATRLAETDAVVNWAYSPDSKLLAVCSWADCMIDCGKYTTTQCFKTTRCCLYHIFCASSGSLLATSTSLLPYDPRILPRTAARPQDELQVPYHPSFCTRKFKLFSPGGDFDVSRPVWAASSSICFMPFVRQIFAQGEGVLQVPVSHWAHLSPCGSMFVTSPCPMVQWLDSHNRYPCPLQHYHLCSGKMSNVIEQACNTSKVVEFGPNWLQAAWVPYPVGAQMYAVYARRSHVVRLIDGRRDFVCCTFNPDPPSWPDVFSMQWSPDGRSLAILGLSPSQTEIISFDDAAPQRLQSVSCIGFSGPSYGCHADTTSMALI